MKEVLLSNCEKSFIIKCILEGKRLDGRNLSDFRNLRISLGSEWGSVHVALGETQVLAQVSCDVVQPKATRPNEGLLHINVELGPMAAQHFEAGRPSELSVQINRILERAFKDSRAVDLESLCIVADEKVWNLRVDINVLNHEGNIIDCASIATLTALSHFKRPDVTTSGDEVIIHTYAEKDPIPIPLHHYPVCVTFAIFNQGADAVADPTAIEERVSEASIVLGFNSYKELCGLHLGGITLTSSQLLLKCANKAAKRAKDVVDEIKSILKDDEAARLEEKSVGFTECVRLNKITSLAQERLQIRLKNFNLNTCLDDFVKNEVKMDTDQNDEDDDDDDDSKTNIKQLNKDSAVLFPLTKEDTENIVKNEWIPNDESTSDDDDDEENDDDGEGEEESDVEEDDEEEEDNSEEEEDEVEEVVVKKKPKIETKTKKQKEKPTRDSSSDSEEETTIIL